jgi:hypothetical protein
MSYEVKLVDGGRWFPAKRVRTTKKMIYFEVYTEELGGPPKRVRKQYKSEGKWWREAIDAVEPSDDEHRFHVHQCPNCSKLDRRGTLVDYTKDVELARTGVRVRFGACYVDNKPLFGVTDDDCPDFFVDPRGKVQTQPGPENYRGDDNLLAF